MHTSTPSTIRWSISIDIGSLTIQFHPLQTSDSVSGAVHTLHRTIVSSDDGLQFIVMEYVVPAIGRGYFRVSTYLVLGDELAEHTDSKEELYALHRYSDATSYFAGLVHQHEEE